MSATEETEKAQRSVGKFLRSENFIGTMVALLSILTAFAGYRAATVDSVAGGHSLDGMRIMFEANRANLSAGQRHVQDISSFDAVFASIINEAEDNYLSSVSPAYLEMIADPDRGWLDEIYLETVFADESDLLDYNVRVLVDILSYDNFYASTNLAAAENYYGSLSAHLRENIENLGEDGVGQIFDDAYFETLYGPSLICYEEANMLFALEQRAGDVADKGQLAMFAFAIGLAMAAWASLLSESGKMRLMFVFFAMVMLVYGTAVYMGQSGAASDVLATAVELSCLP